MRIPQVAGQFFASYSFALLVLASHTGAAAEDQANQRAQGYVVPESFTHGSAAERVSCFKRGFEGGAISNCDTFAADSGA